MVITSNDIDNVPPKERIKLLKKNREIKKKELERLMREKEEELREKEKELRETERSLEEAKEDIIEEVALMELEQLELSPDSPSTGADLEETISKEKIDPIPKGTISYGATLDSLNAPKSIYDLTSNEVYDEVKRIEQKGYITSSEQHWLNEVKGQLSSVQERYSQQEINRIDNMYKSIPRIESVLKRIDDQLYNLNKMGDSLSAIYKQ